MDWKTQAIKRAIDIAGASVGLAITAPLFPLIAAAVKLTSNGPIFYTQRRVASDRRSGIAPRRAPISERRGGEPFRTFTMYKFRTMRTDAEKGRGAVLASKDDPRLTPIGGFLRRTRLDELPQLMHVLSGEMSLVGPRPERPELMQKLEDALPFFGERVRLIKPGLTGLAQLELGYDGSPHRFSKDKDVLAQFFTAPKKPAVDGIIPQSFGNKLLYDLAYSAILESRDPWQYLFTDLSILVRTPAAMLLGIGI